MKEMMKLLGIIAIVAVIGFGFAACGGDGDGGGDDDITPSKFIGTYKSDENSGATLEIKANNCIFTYYDNSTQHSITSNEGGWLANSWGGINFQAPDGIFINTTFENNELKRVQLVKWEELGGGSFSQSFLDDWIDWTKQ